MGLAWSDAEVRTFKAFESKAGDFGNAQEEHKCKEDANALHGAECIEVLGLQKFSGEPTTVARRGAGHEMREGAKGDPVVGAGRGGPKSRRREKSGRRKEAAHCARAAGGGQGDEIGANGLGVVGDRVGGWVVMRYVVSQRRNCATER